MDKTLQHKILAALIAAGTLGLYTANPVNAENYYTVEKDGDIITGDYDIILGNEHNFTFDNGSASILLGAGSLDGTASSNDSTIYIGQNAEIGSIRGGFSQNAVSGNTIYFNGTVHQDIYGGYSIAGPASENTVILNGTLGETSQIYGGFSIAGDAVKNNIISNNTTIYNKVYGGISDTGNAVGNSVTINGGSAGVIYGGFSNTSNAVGNSVTINDGAVANIIYGGYTENGTANGNIITINDSTIKNNIYGGYTETSGDATGNNVTINNGNMEYNNIYGGYSHNGIAEGNTVEVNSGTLNSRSIYGGLSTSDNNDSFTANKTEANNNQVIIKEAVITSSTLNIFGGYAKGNTNNNLVLIEGDHSIDGIYGGISENGNSNNNAIIIKGKVNSSYISAGNSNNGNADNNIVFISNDSSTRLAAGGIANNGTANNNLIFITDSKANEIYGGFTDNSNDDYDAAVNADYNAVIINNSEAGSVTGGYTNSGTANNNFVSISDSDTHGDIYGGRSINGNAENNIIIISKTDAASGRIAGGSSKTGNAEGNTVLISDDSTISGRIYGGRSSEGNANSNTVLINNSTLLDNVYGGGSSEGNANGNIVIINDSKLPNIVFGGYSDEGNTNDNIVIINDSTYDSLELPAVIYGGCAENSTAERNIVQITGGKTEYVYGGHSGLGEAKDNIVTINGGEVSNVYGGTSTNGSSSNNKVYIKDGTTRYIIAGYSTNKENINNVENNSVYIGGGKITGDVNGGVTYKGNAIGNNVIISGGNITGDVYGGISENGNADNNNVVINGGKITGLVYGGKSNNGTATNNNIIISGNADITKAYLFGSNISNSNINLYESNVNNNNTGNTLTIDGWSGSTQSVKNFSDINFNNVNWKNGETVLKITNGSKGNLTNTNINLNSIAGGSSIKAGDKMTFIASNTNLSDEVNYNINDTFTAGVALEGTATASFDNEGNVSFTVNNLKASSQAVSAAQTRAASAAFVNQGTDLISDSLDTISRDDNYGVKTFAAVHGNRSKYDVADDIKINGWSTIVGVGNADKFDNGSELSWGVFYENGSGNYRTYNSFNNEFFRGDGSMVYNGGGIAARYENKNGVYTEGSLRAGMLKNELDNAMRNVNGSYGYETESAYYGAHIGVGKIISLSDSSDLDIYGKFFHTYTEGDSVTIADDKFDFDSITSDRLRVGARITSNKENKFSTYYGLAYEYEFNGDADMTAQGLRADTQSLQGSSVMAEVGFNYQPTPDSPWSFDLNMRGYTGEHQGGSFNVQAMYTF